MRLEQLWIDVIPVAHGKGCQVQSGHPALGFFFQSDGCGRFDLNSQGQLKKSHRFRYGKAQVLGSDLRHLTLRAQRGNRQRGIMPADDYQMQGLRGMLQYFGEQIVYQCFLYEVIIIEHHDESLLDPVQFVQQAGD